MEHKQAKKNLYAAAIWVVLLALSLIGVTYAWFTFGTVATVEGNHGKVGSNGVNLLISNSPDGPFAETCDLVLSSSTDKLRPITTDDLVNFYVPVSVDLTGSAKDGKYKDVSSDAEKYAWHGYVYLQCDGDCTVSMDRDNMYFGDDETALSAMKFGIIFYTNSGTTSYMFNTEASAIDDACGHTVCTLEKDEIATVEYWLFLDGDDEDCLNQVQGKDISLQIGFFGDEVKTVVNQ